MQVMTREEREALLSLTLAPGWRVLKAAADKLCTGNQDRLVKSNFTELGTVRFLQGEISGIQRLFECVQRRIAELEGD